MKKCSCLLESTVVPKQLYRSYLQGGKAIEAVCLVSLFVLKASSLFQKMNKSKRENIGESGC